MGEYDTFRIEQGNEFVKIYQARILSTTENEKSDDTTVTLSNHKRHFCCECGSYLWAYDDRYPQWIYPFASCIDTALPKVDEQVHMMIDFKLDHVDIPTGEHVRVYNRYPELSIEQWHKDRGLYGTYSIERQKT
jgi:hypothetical protein